MEESFTRQQVNEILSKDNGFEIFKDWLSKVPRKEFDSKFISIAINIDRTNTQLKHKNIEDLQNFRKSVEEHFQKVDDSAEFIDFLVKIVDSKKQKAIHKKLTAYQNQIGNIKEGNITVKDLLSYNSFNNQLTLDECIEAKQDQFILFYLQNYIQNVGDDLSQFHNLIQEVKNSLSRKDSPIRVEKFSNQPTAISLEFIEKLPTLQFDENFVFPFQSQNLSAHELSEILYKQCYKSDNVDEKKVGILTDILQGFFIREPIYSFVNLINGKDPSDQIFFITNDCNMDEANNYITEIENCDVISRFAGKAKGILLPDERVQIYALKALTVLLNSHITDNSGILTIIEKLRNRINNNQINFDNIFLTDQQREAITSFNSLQKIFDEVKKFDGNIGDFVQSLGKCQGVTASIITDAEILTGNFKELNPLISGSDDDFNTVPEYQYVKDVMDGALIWEVSKDGITLVDPKSVNANDESYDKNSLKPPVTSQQLLLAVNKFKVTTTQNQDDNRKQQNVRLFVQKFEKADILAEKIIERQQFSLDEIELYDREGLDSEQIEGHLKDVTDELDAIKNTIRNGYKGDRAAFTIPHLCLLKRIKNDPVIEDENERNEQIDSIIRSSFPQVEANHVRTQLNKQFETLEDLIDLLPEKVNVRQNKNRPEKVFENNDMYLLLEKNIKNASKSITLYEPGDLSDMVSLFSTLIHYFNNENGYFMRQCQFLICEPNTTKLQIESFFTMFDATINNNKLTGYNLFIAINPQEMMPDVLEFFINSFLPYMSKPTNTARLLIIYDKSKPLSQQLASATSSLSKASPTGYLKDVVGGLLRSTLNGTSDMVKAKSYYIYNKVPRIGKSQLVYEHILRHQTVNDREPLYFRLLIDNEITRDTLAQFLIEADKIGKRPYNDGRKICVHFNIDGQIDHHFTLYLFQLLTFGCINDGVNLPFAYNNNMIFYFEIGSKPGSDIESFFPIAMYMKEIPITTDIRDRFNFNEYVVRKDSQYDDQLKITEEKMSRGFLARAAALIQMVNYGATFIGDEYEFVDLAKDTMEVVRKVKPENAKNIACRERKDINVHYKKNKDENTLSQIDKNTNTYTYQEYIKYWNDLVSFFERHSECTYKILSETFQSIIDDAFHSAKGLEGLSNSLTIGQIIDIAKIIDHFKGPILSYQTYTQEYELQQKFTIMFGQLLISTAVNNVGFPYQQPASVSDFGGDEDTKRLMQIIEFQKQIHKLLAITDPGKESAQQAFAILPHSEVTTEKLYEIYGLQISEEMKSITNQFIDKKKLKRLANFQHQLFSVMNDIIKLSTYEPELHSAVYTIKIWDDMSQDEKRKVAVVWNREVIEDLISNKKFDDIEQLKEILNYGNDDENNGLQAPVEVTPFRTFMNQMRDLLVEAKNYCKYRQSDDDEDSQNQKSKNEKESQEEKKPILINVKFMDQNGRVNYGKTGRPVIAAEELVQRFRGFLSDQNTKIGSFAFTEHSIIHFLNMIYRIYAGIPIILMGETGSGKTFSIECLSDLIASEVHLAKKCIDGGTTRQDLIKFIRPNINEIKIKREIYRAHEIIALRHSANKPKILRRLIKWIIETNQVHIPNSMDYTTAKTINELTNADNMPHNITDYIRKIYSNNDLKQKYHISAAIPQEAINAHISHHFAVSIEDIESRAPSLLFFLDEVNTASCQWYIKDLIVDRYFENEPLPPYVRFISAVNPSRNMPAHATKSLKALDPPAGSANDALSKLVYKVHHMPESFIPFLMPADPDRDYFSYKDISELKAEGKIKKEEDLTEEKLLTFWDMLSDFDLSVSTIVKSRFNKKAYPFDVPESKKEKYKLVKDTPQCYKERYGYDYPFARSDKFSMEFSETFTNKYFGADMTEKFLDIIAKLNIIGCRVIHKAIYDDKSFSSLREPDRCMQLLTYFFKFGIFEDYRADGDKNYQVKRFRLAFILAFSLTYVLRLASYIVDSSEDSDRKKFLGYIIEAWRDHQVEGFEAPADFDDWSDIIKNEFMEYSNLLVDRNEGISLNEALIENIWATYHTIVNNIPLWIIGMPGTSKSLAVNVVLNKMYLHRIRSKKIMELPQSVTYQTYMCSQYSTSAALINQISRIVYNHRVKMSQHNIIVQILEEIGHADLSPYLPLKCLHQIIDDGYIVTTIDGSSLVKVPLVIIGLSNYKMDSAKLNRGILLVRGDLGTDQTINTAKDIFDFAVRQINSKVNDAELNYFVDQYISKAATEYTNKFNQFDASFKKYFGLRDFYGFLHCLSKLYCDNNIDDNTLELLKVLFRNFSGITDKEKLDIVIKSLFRVFQDESKFNNTTVYPLNLIKDSLSMKPFSPTFPLMRHLLVHTTDLTAFTILLENSDIPKNIEIFFSQKMTNISDDQWISNELQKLATALREGRTVIFVGKHPCFDSLYDIFNLRYQAIPGKNIALIANAGDSYSVTVSPKFHCIIIVEDDTYDSLPPPFLNRFEKQRLTFEDTNLNRDVTSKLRDLLGSFGPQAHISDQYIPSVDYTSTSFHNKDEILLDTLLLLALPPASVLNTYIRTSNKDVKNAIEQWISSSAVFTSIESLVWFFQNRRATNMFLGLFLKEWTNEQDRVLSGVQAIALVPSLNENEQITFTKLPNQNKTKTTVITLDKDIIEDKIREDIETALFDVDSDNGEAVVLFTTKKLTHTFKFFTHIQWIVTNIRQDKRFAGRILHTIFVVDMNGKTKDCLFTQSCKWPVIYMDTVKAPSFSRNNTILSKLLNGAAFGGDMSLSDIIFDTFNRFGINSVSDDIVERVNKFFEFSEDDFGVVIPWMRKLLLSLSQVPKSICEVIKIELIKKVTTVVSFLVSIDRDKQEITEETCSLLDYPFISKNIISLANTTIATITPYREQFSSAKLGTIFSIMWNMIISGEVERLDDQNGEEEQQNDEEEEQDSFAQIEKLSKKFTEKLYKYISNFAVNEDEDEEEDENEEEEEEENIFKQLLQENLTPENIEEIVKAYVLSISPETMNIDKLSLETITNNICNIANKLFQCDKDVSLILYPFSLPAFIKFFNIYANLIKFVPDWLPQYNFDNKYLLVIAGINTLIAKLLRKALDTFFGKSASDMMNMTVTELNTIMNTIRFVNQLERTTIAEIDDEENDNRERQMNYGLLTDNGECPDFRDQIIFIRAFNFYKLVLSQIEKINCDGHNENIYNLFTGSTPNIVENLINLCKSITGKDTLPSEIIDAIIRSISI